MPLSSSHPMGGMACYFALLPINVTLSCQQCQCWSECWLLPLAMKPGVVSIYKVWLTPSPFACMVT